MPLIPVSSVTVDIPDEAVAEQVRAMLEPELEMLAERIASDARNRAAFTDRTGKLRKSIKARKSKFEGGGYIVVARAPHAHLVEFGHAMIDVNGRTVGHVAAFPFLRPARDRVMRAAIHEIQARLGGAYDERG
uniref:Phage protein, HK97 gp10 family n=1 Tax=Nitratidesulfovibrio vulgaris (strain DSM 19637 / Miyazaki F) TaxID=883 RepID=B8DS59_NITV9